MATEYYNRLALHYSECNKHYYRCQDCEREFRWLRIFGKCTEHHVNLKKCIQAQRRIQLEENNRQAKEKQERVKEYLASHSLPELDYFSNKV